MLTTDEATAVARLTLEVQQHYGRPQDVEWAFDDQRLWLVQARPITTLTDETPSAAPEETPAVALLQGLPAAPGRGRGAVRILHSPA